MQKLADAIKGADKSNQGFTNEPIQHFRSFKSFSTCFDFNRDRCDCSGIGFIDTTLNNHSGGNRCRYKSNKTINCHIRNVIRNPRKLGGQLFEKPLETLRKIYDFVKKQLSESLQSWGKIIAGLFTFDMDKIKKVQTK